MLPYRAFQQLLFQEFFPSWVLGRRLYDSKLAADPVSITTTKSLLDLE